MVPVYEKRRAVLKAINKFWPVALMNHPMLAMHVQHNSDQAALSYLEDVWLTRDAVESRCFTLEFVSVVLCISDLGICICKAGWDSARTSGSAVLRAGPDSSAFTAGLSL